MTDETKKLFDAPWEADVCCEIHDKNERLICICCPGEPHIANRLARLPELYDALMEAVNEKCRKCIDNTRRRGDRSYINPYDFIELGCPYNRTCLTSYYLDLLKKVRDGE